MQENVSKIKNGFYLPKSSLIPSYQNQFMTQRQRMLNIQNGGSNGKKIPPQVDWTFLFNLSIFVLFICSLFYICLYRYRNKEQLRKEKELKQKQLVWEFKQALEEQNKKQAEMKKEQIMNNRMNNQMMVSSNIDNVRLNLENPYLINNNNMNGINYDLNFEPSFYPNFSNNYNVNYMQNKNLELNYNQHQNKNQNNDSYELSRKTYKLDKDNMNTESTFMNQTNFKNWI